MAGRATALRGQHGYPRPQLQRAAWNNLNGRWEFALDPDAAWHHPSQVRWTAAIQVPFSPETEASGVNERGFFRACWYRRRIELPRLMAPERVILHFGAVDYEATVWVSGHRAIEHQGGYTPFAIDLTDFVRDAGETEIVVRAMTQ